MLRKPSIYNRAIFRQFRNLDRDNPYALVHFYEANEREITTLGVEASFYFKVKYFNALFEIDEYQKALGLADEILEFSILNNIHYFQGEDIYRRTLYKKAFSLAALHEYPEAQAICAELVRMVPGFRPYQKLLRKCVARQRPLLVKRLFATGVGLYLLSTILIVFNLLVVETFHEENLDRAEMIRYGIFFAGLGVIVFGESWHLLKTRQRVRIIVDNARIHRMKKGSE